MEGKSLEEIEKVRESGKRPYQKILLTFGSAVLAMVVCILMALIIREL